MLSLIMVTSIMSHDVYIIVKVTYDILGEIAPLKSDLSRSFLLHVYFS